MFITITNIFVAHLKLLAEIKDFCDRKLIALFVDRYWRRNDTQHNDMQHNDTQHNDTRQNNTQHKDIQHNDTQQNDTQDNSK